MRKIKWPVVAVVTLAFMAGLVADTIYNYGRDVAAVAVAFGADTAIVFVKGDGRLDKHPLAPEGSDLQADDLRRLTKIPKERKVGFVGVCPKHPTMSTNNGAL